MDKAEFDKISKMSFLEFMCLGLDKVLEVRDEMEKKQKNNWRDAPVVIKGDQD